MDFDFQGARDEGYSDDEILSYLSENSPDFDVMGAVKEGYSPEDIYEYLSTKKTTPEERDVKKLKHLAGAHYVPLKSKEEFDKLTRAEKKDYLDDLKMQQEIVGAGQGVKGALSGLTFGASKHVGSLLHAANIIGEDTKESINKSLSPEEFETLPNWEAHGGEFLGSVAPLHGLTKLVAYPVGKVTTKLLSKSPVLRKQAESLLTMFGVGAADKALHSLAEGEVPSAEEVLGKGTQWAALDAILRGAGYTGRFISALAKGYKESGLNRKNAVNSVIQKIEASGLNPKVAADQKAIADLAMKAVEEEVAMQAKYKSVNVIKSGVEEAGAELPGRVGITPEVLEGRAVAKDTIEKIQNQKIHLAEPYEPHQIDFRFEAEALEKEAAENALDKVGVRAATEEDLGNAVKQDVEKRYAAEQEAYQEFYEQANKAGRKIKYMPTEAGDSAIGRLLRMGEYKTAPEDFAKATKSLIDFLEDIGYKIEKNANGAIKSIHSERPVTIADTMELSRRLAKIIKYDSIDKSARDILRGLIGDTKTEIRKMLKLHDPEALAAYNLAEEEVARVKGVYDTPAMRQIRAAKKPEQVAKLVENPSTFGELKRSLSPEQFAQVERELLEKIRKSKYDPARDIYKGLKKHMTEEGRKAAEEIIAAKNPYNPYAQVKAQKRAVLSEVSESLTNGTRPDKTLKLWKTPKGRQLVTDTFKNSPNWKNVKGYLEDQSFHDMVSSVLKKDGSLDWKKLDTMLSNPSMRKDIRALGGEEALEFFENLEKQSTQLQNNMKLLEAHPTPTQAERVAKESKQALEKGARVKKETTGARGKQILERMATKDFPINASKRRWADWIKDVLGLEYKTALGMFGASKILGSIFGVSSVGGTAAAGALISHRMLEKLLTSPRARQVFRKAARHQNDPLKFIMALGALEQSTRTKKE